ncbi:type II toxin-antitoxin system RelE/ParE family toxin [Sorlinia euscelidii]|uniref:type II toxin-antitoxin system RelE/ParE family toxin n=1 Tax=Sorlinia euscelidii TaxID=3081148 RepID=UPI00374E1FF2
MEKRSSRIVLERHNDFSPFSIPPLLDELCDEPLTVVEDEDVTAELKSFAQWADPATDVDSAHFRCLIQVVEMLKVTAAQRLNLDLNRHITIFWLLSARAVFRVINAQRCLRERVDDLCEATRNAVEIDHGDFPIVYCGYTIYDAYMILSFKHKGLELFWLRGVRKGINPAHSGKLQRLLDSLNVASSPDDLIYPGSGMHRLTGMLDGYWSLKVNGNWRVIFRFVGHDVELVDYLDYH